MMTYGAAYWIGNGVAWAAAQAQWKARQAADAGRGEADSGGAEVETPGRARGDDPGSLYRSVKDSADVDTAWQWLASNYQEKVIGKTFNLSSEHRRTLSQRVHINPVLYGNT